MNSWRERKEETNTCACTHRPIVKINKRGKKSGCIWQPAQLYHVQIMMPMVLIALLHWFATFQTQTSSTMKSDSIFEGLVYSNFLPPLFNPSIACVI